jgi:hypothetical protein
MKVLINLCLILSALLYMAGCQGDTHRPVGPLADYDHPLVQETAQQITQGEKTIRGKLEKIFYYVRDDILFGFPKDGDLVKASETIELGMGQCNTKGTLFLALCKASGIPARIHFSLIDKEIQRGLFTGLRYKLMPRRLSHSWVEVKVDGTWRRLDSYINDEAYFRTAVAELKKRGWDTGYSVSCPNGACSCDFNLDEEQFVQMGAVVEDHGIWNDPADFFATDQYKNRPNALVMFFYRLKVGTLNRTCTKMRNTKG